MSCRQLEQAATAGELQPRGLLQLEMWRACREITRTEGGRGAVRAAELGDRFCDSFVQIPPPFCEYQSGALPLDQLPENAVIATWLVFSGSTAMAGSESPNVSVFARFGSVFATTTSTTE